MKVAPPDDLSKESKALWKRVVAEQVSAGRAAMLGEALRCLDRLKQVQHSLHGAPLTTTTPRSGATHVHPLLKIESELRRQFSSLWQCLHLHFSPRIDNFSKDLADDGQ